jgi:hypothetical protein
VKFLRRKLTSGNPKVVFLTLIILDSAMQHCGYPFHQQVCTKEFMNILMEQLQKKNQIDQVSQVTLFLQNELIGEGKTHKN